jgi:hypothetical protein
MRTPPNKLKPTPQMREIAALYLSGKNCEQVGAAFGLTKNCVLRRLRLLGIALRRRPNAPFIMLDGIKYGARSDGYFYSTVRIGKYQKRYHVALWEKTHGQKVPEGYCVAFVDGDAMNTDPDNLDIYKRQGERHPARARKIELKRCVICGGIIDTHSAIGNRRPPRKYKLLRVCSIKCRGGLISRRNSRPQRTIQWQATSYI